MEGIEPSSNEMCHWGWKTSGVNDIRERQTERGEKGERRACKQRERKGNKWEKKEETDKMRLLEAEEEAKFK